MNRRLERISSYLRQEVSAILANDVGDHRIEGMVTVTDVDVSPDMRRARVFVSIYGASDNRRVLRALSSTAGFVGMRLGKRLRSKSVPSIEFRLDQSIGRSAEISETISRIAAEPPAGEQT